MARLEEIQRENKATMSRLVASVNAVRQSLERGMPCTTTTNCFGEAIKEFNGQVKVIGFDEQISRVVVAIDSLKNRENECCNSDVVSLGIEQKKLSDAIRELRERIETLKKMNEDGGVGKKREAIMLLLGVGALFGICLGGLVNNVMHATFPKTANPYESDARDLKRCSKEISEGYRHYSNLRFAVFTLFVAVSGALGALNFGKDYQEMTRPLHPVLPMVGIVLTIAFCVMEFVVDLNQTEYFYMAKAVRNSSRRPLGFSSQKAIALGARIESVSEWNCRVRYFIWLIFGTVLFVWVSVWIFSG